MIALWKGAFQNLWEALEVVSGFDWVNFFQSYPLPTSPILHRPEKNSKGSGSIGFRDSPRKEAPAQVVGDLYGELVLYLLHCRCRYWYWWLVYDHQRIRRYWYWWLIYDYQCILVPNPPQCTESYIWSQVPNSWNCLMLLYIQRKCYLFIFLIADYCPVMSCRM